MSGYRSKRVANTRTAMGTTDQRPTGSGAVMLGLTGSGPGSSPWARRAAQRRAYTSMLQKKCAEGDKASCINPVAAVEIPVCVSTGILVSPGDIDITWTLVLKDGAADYYLKASIRFNNICGNVNITLPTDSSGVDICQQFDLSGIMVGAGAEGTNVVFSSISPNYAAGEGGPPSGVIYNIVGSGEDEGKIELYWDNNPDEILQAPPNPNLTKLTLTYAKHGTSSNNLKATEEYVPGFTDIDTNAFDVPVAAI